jgi:hypothetical protein
MKKIKLILFASFTLVIFYSCKKTTTNTNTASTDVVAPLLVENLIGSLNGSDGGLNINQGLNPPTGQLAIANPGNKNSLNNPLSFFLNRKSILNGRPVLAYGPYTCGLNVDTTIMYQSPASDTLKITIGSHIKYMTQCNGNYATGLNLMDSLQLSAISPSYTLQLNNGSTLVLSLPTNSTQQNSDFILNGKINLNYSLTVKTGKTGFVNCICYFNFNNLDISRQNAGILSGTTTFITSGKNGNGLSWNYSGTITYLPNNQATLIINGISYLVDLSSGSVAKS